MTTDENPKPNSGANSKPEQLTKLLGTWLRVLAETCRLRENEDLTPEKIKSYVLVLSDIPADALERGLRRCAKECTWFPTAAEIRQKVGNFQLAAEQAWELVQRVVFKHWHPDIGFHGNKPELDGATEYAMRQVGGLARIHDATEKEFPFIRKDFIAAHQRHGEEGGEQLRMSRQLAESTLSRLQSGWREAQPKLQAATEEGDRGAVADEVLGAAGLKHFPRQLTPEEHAKRIEELEAQARKLRGESA